MLRRVYYAPNFQKRWRRLPKSVRTQASQKEALFRADPFSPSLKTHKLSGKLKEYWSFSINYQYRIVFRFLKKDEVLLVDAGTHSVYR